jgi:hypothetical protein
MGLRTKLGVESVDDLKKILSEMGYSQSAVNEILKWYNENSSHRKT